MRILANENVTRTVIEGLRTTGNDVLSVKESLRGEKDDAILVRAQTEKRIVLTHDKDFGALAFRVGLLPSAASFSCAFRARTRTATTSVFSKRSRAARTGKGISP